MPLLWAQCLVEMKVLVAQSSPTVCNPMGYIAHQAPLSIVAQVVKNLPIMQETRVQSLGREDPLEKKMATHSSTLA